MVYTVLTPGVSMVYTVLTPTLLEAKRLSIQQ